MKSHRGISSPEILTALALLIVAGAFLIPLITTAVLNETRKIAAQNDVLQIAHAVSQYEADYGPMPSTPTRNVGGDLLAALMGQNPQLNPRNTIYLQVPPAKRGKSGLKKGRFVDPWGLTYKIAIAPNQATSVLAGTNQTPIPKRVGVWNNPTPDTPSNTSPAHPYVTSWE